MECVHPGPGLCPVAPALQGLCPQSTCRAREGSSRQTPRHPEPPRPGRSPVPFHSVREPRVCPCRTSAASLPGIPPLQGSPNRVAQPPPRHQGLRHLETGKINTQRLKQVTPVSGSKSTFNFPNGSIYYLLRIYLNL